MERITIAEANARSFARVNNCFDLIGARSTPPDFMLMGLGGKGVAVRFFYLQPGETQAELWERLVRQLTHLSWTIFGLGNADRNLFFENGAKDNESSAPAQDGAGVGMPWIKHL